jgi:hypothetical protein
MEMRKESTANLSWLGRMENVWHEVLVEVMKRGFHGAASVEVQITDGTIQKITRRVEQFEK